MSAGAWLGVAALALLAAALLGAAAVVALRAGLRAATTWGDAADEVDDARDLALAEVESRPQPEPRVGVGRPSREVREHAADVARSRAFRRHRLAAEPPAGAVGRARRPDVD